MIRIGHGQYYSHKANETTSRNVISPVIVSFWVIFGLNLDQDKDQSFRNCDNSFSAGYMTVKKASLCIPNGLMHLFLLAIPKGIQTIECIFFT